MRIRLLAGVLLLLAASSGRAEQITENRPDGTVLRTYATDDQGRRDGGCVEYHPNGKVHIRSNYRRGRLHGVYQTYDDKGRRRVTAKYREGRLHGEYVDRDEKGEPTIQATYVDGEKHGAFVVLREGVPISTQSWERGLATNVDGLSPYTKSKDAIRDAVEEIFNSVDPLEKDAADPKARSRGESLRLLKIFRYLCDVPYEDIRLDAQMNAWAEAGARLCEAIGRLDHTPANPGWPEEDYKFGYIGTSRSNLYMGHPERKPMEASVPAYMDDSDASNIDRVGHRRWCINPRMLRAGFGSAGRFSAMYAHDASRKEVPEFDFVAYPPPGFMPVYYFGERHAWSVSLNPKKFDKPERGGLKVTVRAVDDDFLRADAPLPLDHFTLSSEGMGLRDCIIFRPKGIELEPDAKYWVEIEGLTRKKKPVPFRYMVHFFEL